MTSVRTRLALRTRGNSRVTGLKRIVPAVLSWGIDSCLALIVKFYQRVLTGPLFTIIGIERLKHFVAEFNQFRISCHDTVNECVIT
ncbi:hypothetical protein SAMN05192561_104147 [Halopenitus malekzadehii]|uniref:Uncharacterized protein n=1 Tax=Halopenitus malekzadehii TaxID=1267564 RepID=A0A1H6IT95_9EURY|nr:hypothetical protein SAMN05192561_104147 [Halopenitus malekzadehii]